jgi:hypothetical protein
MAHGVTRSRLDGRCSVGRPRHAVRHAQASPFGSVWRDVPLFVAGAYREWVSPSFSPECVRAPLCLALRIGNELPAGIGAPDSDSTIASSNSSSKAGNLRRGVVFPPRAEFERIRIAKIPV